MDKEFDVEQYKKLSQKYCDGLVKLGADYVFSVVIPMNGDTNLSYLAINKAAKAQLDKSTIRQLRRDLKAGVKKHTGREFIKLQLGWRK